MKCLICLLIIITFCPFTAFGYEFPQLNCLTTSVDGKSYYQFAQEYTFFPTGMITGAWRVAIWEPDPLHSCDCPLCQHS